MVALLVVVAFVGGSGGWMPNQAAAQTEAAYAFLWANEPTTDSYTPDERYQYNSTGAVNTVTRTGVGTYTAYLPGVGQEAGHFQVTGQGEAASCTNVRWVLAGDEFQVEVACYAAGGAPVDSGFHVFYIAAEGVSAPDSSYEFAYLWANEPTTDSYTPDERYQYNSRGVVNTVIRTGVGAYTANLPDVGQEAGTFQVTGQGEAASCTNVRWILAGAEMQVEVVCFDASGSPIDSGFMVLYVVAEPPSEPGAYLWANEPTTDSYTPDERYQYNSTGEVNTVTRTGVGTYTANLPAVGQEAGIFMVTGQGAATSCTIRRWILADDEHQVELACFDASGAPVDSGFMVLYEVPSFD